MTDIALHPQALDLAISAGDLVPDDSLRTAVIISLFTDREAPELSEGERRGWWGDVLAVTGGDRIGSRLWTLRREMLTERTATRVREAVIECLGWMIEDGVARNVTVTTELQKPQTIACRIVIERPNGQRELVRFALPWSASLGASNFEQNATYANSLSDLAALYEFEYFVHYPEVDG